MDSVFRSAREKLEKEHRESKESGKLKFEREKKDKDAAERQRRAIESSQRARRLEAIEAQIEAQMKKVEEEKERRKSCNIPWISKMMMQRRAQDEDGDEVFISDDDEEEEGSDLEVGDAPGTVQQETAQGLLGMSEQEKNKKRIMRQRMFRRRMIQRMFGTRLKANHIE